MKLATPKQYDELRKNYVRLPKDTITEQFVLHELELLRAFIDVVVENTSGAEKTAYKKKAQIVNETIEMYRMRNWMGTV